MEVLRGVYAEMSKKVDPPMASVEENIDEKGSIASSLTRSG